MLDTAYTVETPDGVELLLRPAGAIVRAVAFLLDVAVRVGILLVAAWLLGAFGELGTGVFLLVNFLVFWLYPVLFEQFMHGQTPGKRMMRLQVLQANGTPVTAAASLLRNLLLVVDFLPSGFAGAAVAMVASRRMQRIGDLVADTVVVHRPEQADAGRGGAAEVLAGIDGQRPLPARLAAGEQQLLLAFAERCGTLSAARREELAGLSGLTDGTGDAGVQVLLEMARGLSGAGSRAEPPR